MTARRDYGAGTVYERAGRWQAQFELPPTADGRRRRRTVSGRTRAEALRNLEAAKRTASAERAVPGQTPLADYLAGWLDDQRGHIRASTLQTYREKARHLAPLGQVAIGRIKPADLRALYRSLAATLSPQSIVHVHRLLHKALGDAMREETIDRNVCDLVRPPAVPNREPTVLDAVQARHLLDAAKDDRFYALWLLAIVTGMREGELLALRWADLDQARGALTVRRGVSRLNGAGWYERPPKSRAGNRLLPLPPFLLLPLREHRERQEAERRACRDWHDMGLIFPSAVGTFMGASALRSRNWRRVLERAGLPPMPPHDLRHSAVSLLLAAGVPPHVVQAIVGHADPRVLLGVYAHSHRADEAEALAGLADRLLGDG